MAEVENHFTVFVRLPFNRGDFVDPPPVSWSAAKERTLWDVISRGQSKGYEIDWHALAERFEVTQPFILQQAAWLYERQLSQVRAQLRKVGNRPSTASSPTPGSVASSQLVGGQPMKRAGSGGSRVPSRMSTQHPGGPAVGTESGTPLSPGRNRPSLPIRNSSAGQGSGGGAAASRPSSGFSRPVSQQQSKEADPVRRTHSRGDSGQHQFSRSPKLVQLEAQDADSDLAQTKLETRRSNPLSLHRRSLSRKDYQAILQSPRPLSQGDAEDVDDDSGDSDDDDDGGGDEDNDDLVGEDEDDSPSFLPFATDSTRGEASKRPGQIESLSPSQDPGATIKGTFDPATAASQTQRAPRHRRSTTETITQAAAAVAAAAPSQTLSHHMSSSTSSLSSASNTRIAVHPTMTKAGAAGAGGAGATTTTTTAITAGAHRRALKRGTNPSANANTLSPRQQAALAHAAGVSPHRRGLGAGGSPSSPSMGSSFSDLEDASVTRSALEEALMSNLGNTTTTMAGVGGSGGSGGGGGGGAATTTTTPTPSAGGGNGSGGGVASRMTTGISQALRSRYFDARGG